MEILSNFSSVYCFISWILGAMFMLMAICIVAMGKEKEPSNKVRFFVTRDNEDALRNPPILWVGVPKKNSVWWSSTAISKPLAFSEEGFKHYGLNYEDFFNMKEGEIREVSINLGDRIMEML